MKRIRYFILLGLILLFPATAYASQPVISVNIPDQKELTDNKYMVSVEITDNPGFSSLQMELYYNKEVLACEKVLPGEVVKGMLTDSNPKTADQKTSAIITAAGFSDTRENGNLATFVFEKPKSGDPEFEFRLVEIMTEDGKKVQCKVDIQDEYGETEKKPGSNGGPSGSDQSHKPEVGDSSGGENDKIPTQTVIHEEVEKETAIGFSDVTTAHWAKGYIGKAVALGLVKGMPDGTFAPDKAMTRAEFATILWNMADRPESGDVTKFVDINTNEWYTKQIAWASQEGYINGISETEFSPNGLITREQAMTILYRYAGCPAAMETLEEFKDKADIYDYALPAMGWAVENNIISGVGDGEIAPKMSATRAQLATIMVRFLDR